MPALRDTKRESMFTIEDLGKTVECPRCHKPGKLVIDVSRARGHRYYYLAVRHSRDERHIIRRLTEAEVFRVTKRARAEEPTTQQAELQQLKARIAELEKENAQLKAQLEALRPIEEWLMYAKGNVKVVGKNEADAIRKFYKNHKGYTQAERALAESIVEPLIERGLSGELSTVIYAPPPLGLV